MLRTAVLLALGLSLLGALPARAESDGVWVAHFVGNGRIEDFRTGSFVELPLERRVQVALFAEGYTHEDLDAGRFDRDVDRWMEEVFAVEPYRTFREAFVIWKRPVASRERVRPGVADTALRLPIRPDGRGVDFDMPDDGETAERLWAGLRGLPVPPGATWPKGGRTSMAVRNVVAHVLVLDPKTGRSGMSGMALLVPDPQNPRRRMATAFGHDLAHEFTHAFARLQDEYLEDRGGPRGMDAVQAGSSSAMLSNLVRQPHCETLPWRHLLPGGSINPSTEQLVGAFGFAGMGYRPEFTCLMNGAHRNAQYYGGDGWLRTPHRLCNFCREVTAFRLLERTGILHDPATSLDEWVASWREPFFRRYGFDVPDELPQRSSDGKAWFQPCRPASAPSASRG